MRIAEAVSWGINYLIEKKIEDPSLETEILLTDALSLPRTTLLSQSDLILNAEEQGIYQEYIKRRGNHEPTAYIVGHQPFMGLDFVVNDNVLIPRPETELMVETIISKLQATNLGATIVDIGTGSGCIAIALAKHLPNARVIGIDDFKAAIDLALNNAQKNGVKNNCCFLLGDLFSPLKEQVDLIVANPPYIPSADIETLQPEVRDWEPRNALDGGRDGLDFIRKIIAEAPKHLKPGGFLAIEFGYRQEGTVRKLAIKHFSELEIISDYSGAPRMLMSNLK